MIDLIATPFTMEDIHTYKLAGASSVVIATPFFSVRGAAYFPEEMLPALKESCVKESVRMLVLVNRFFTEEELPRLIAFLSKLKEIGVDGIYYGDEGVLYEASKLEMEHLLIYAPDTLLTNHDDVQYYIEQGIQGVAVSKEITLDEICSIASFTPGNIEVTIHGRVNMMHSKRRLLHNYLSFIHSDIDVSDKRTLYIMEETREEHMPILEDEFGTHVFSGYTLASFKEIKQMIAHGVTHMKIDGIFHDSAYVCEALQLYTSILEGANADEIYEAYGKSYISDHVTSGFYYTKTSKLKVGEDA